MATRLLLPASALSTAITPTPDAAWEDVSILARSICKLTSISDAMATVSFTDSDETDKDVLFRQWVSATLTPGQAITPAQAIKAQVRALQALTAGPNLFVSLGIRIINGTTVQKTVLTVTRDATAVAVSPASLTNRQFSANSASGAYTTVAGDRIVVEMGIGGDPGGLRDHDSDMRFGDAAASDLSEDDSSTTDNRPWVEFADTLTFQGGAYPYVQAGADDGTWYATGSGFDTNLANGDCFGEDTTDGLGAANAFFRIQNVPIPKGSTINSAVLTFNPRSDQSGTTCRIRFKAVKEANATAPTSFADAGGRSVTTAAVDWSPGAWTGGTPADSPDLKTVVQEITDQATWASGNAIVFYGLDNGSDTNARRRIFKYDDGGGSEVFVTITFTPPASDAAGNNLMLMGVG